MMRIIEDAPLKLPDRMGIWQEDGEWVALPQSMYTRGEARIFCMKEWHCGFTEVRALSRWMRYEPIEWPDLDNKTYIQDCWNFCKPTDPNAFKVWLCEST